MTPERGQDGRTGWMDGKTQSEDMVGSEATPAAGSIQAGPAVVSTLTGCDHKLKSKPQTPRPGHCSCDTLLFQPPARCRSTQQVLGRGGAPPLHAVRRAPWARCRQGHSAQGVTAEAAYRNV